VAPGRSRLILSPHRCLQQNRLHLMHSLSTRLALRHATHCNFGGRRVPLEGNAYATRNSEKLNLGKTFIAARRSQAWVPGRHFGTPDDLEGKESGDLDQARLRLNAEGTVGSVND